MTTENTPIKETAASDTLQTHPINKVNLLSMIVTDLAKKSFEDLSTLAQSLEMSQHGADGVSPGAAAQNQGSIQAKGDPMSGMHTAVKEDLEKAFEGTELTEEFKNKATVLFEAAINAAVALKEAEITEAAEARIAEEVETIKTEMIEHLDGFLDYVAEEWMEKNKVAVCNELKLDLFNDFQEKLKTLFQESYIEIPDDKLDVLADTMDKMESVEEKFNEQVTKNIELVKENNRLKADKTFAEMTEGMVLTDIEKFKTLAGDLLEGTSDVQDLTTKLTVIKESHFKAGKPAVATVKNTNEGKTVTVNLTEDEAVVKTADPEMAEFVQAIKRSVKAI